MQCSSRRFWLETQQGSARASNPPEISLRVLRPVLWALEEAVMFSLKLKQVLHVLSMEQHVSSVDVESASKTTVTIHPVASPA